MTQVSSVASHPEAATIRAELASEKPLRAIARDFGLPLSSLHRERRKLVPAPNGTPAERQPRNAPVQAPEDQDEREAEALVRAARKHLKAALNKAEDRDRNGAITAAIKALEHRAKLRGKLQPNSVNVLSVIGLPPDQARSIIDQHNRLSSAPTPDLLKHAGSCLGAHVLRSDPLALRILADLNALAQRRSSATVEE